MPRETTALPVLRARSAPFFGREDALAELARLSAGDRHGRGWVLLTGGPGSGKSSLLDGCRERLTRAGQRVAHHVLRTDCASSDRPEIIARSLGAQIAAIHPSCAAEGASTRSLGELLARVSAERLVPRKEQQILLVDGLDQVERDGSGKNPLPRFLPSALPAGVVILCASEPADPHLGWLEDRESVRGLHLDSPRWTASNERACQAFWAHHAPRLDPPLAPGLVDQALGRGKGNLLYAEMLRRRFALDPAARKPDRLPDGLGGLAAELRDELFGDDAGRASSSAAILGLLAAARDPLSWSAIREALSAPDLPEPGDLPLAARLLLRVEQGSAPPAHAFAHPFFRALVASALGKEAIGAHHEQLGATLGRWPPLDRRDRERRRYALRHALSHALEAGDLGRVAGLGGDLDFLEVKCREEGAAAVEGDLRRATARLAGGPAALGISTLQRAVSAESNHLLVHPEGLPALVYNRLRSSGWTQAQIESTFRFPRGLPAPRLRHPVRLDQGVELTLSGHGAEVNACAITPDSRQVISASSDRTLRVWDLESGQLVATLAGHTDEISACAVSPDGSRAASAASDRTLRIWDLSTRLCVLTLKRRAERATACVFTPDGQRVICAAEGDVIEVWDLPTARRVKVLPGYAEEISARSLSPDGETVFSSSYDNRIEVWKLGTGLLDTLLIGHTASANACAVTPDGARAVSASYDGTLRVWDLRTGESQRTLAGHGATINACAITPDGKQVLSGSADHRLKLWDLDSGKNLDTFTGHTEGVTDCAVSPDGTLAVSASADHTLKIWGLAQSRTAWLGHGGEVLACAVAEGGAKVVSASADKTLKVWDTSTGAVLLTLSGHGAGVNACAFAPDGRRIVSASYDRSLKVWDAASGALLSTLTGHSAGVNACTVSADGKTLVSASYDKTLLVWELATGRVVATARGHGDFVNACALAPDHKRALSASADKTLRLWELSTGKTLAVLSGHSGGVNACVITPDGRYAVSASYDKTLRVWDLETAKTIKILPGHSEGVTACAITPDGLTVVSASYDGTLRVWDLESGDCWGRTLGLCPFRGVAVSPGLIAAGDAQGNVWMLDLPDREEIPPSSSGLPRIDLKD